MKLMQSIKRIVLPLVIVLATVSDISAKPQYDRYNEDDDFERSHRQPPAKQPATLIDNLKSGYYYIDNGSITPAAGARTRQRRQDYFATGFEYTPLVRYQRRRTKRKKLFVPNFFG